MTTRHEATKAAAAQLKAGSPCPTPPPKALTLGSIKTNPALFQFRKPLPHASSAHVAALTKPVRGGQTLEAVEVWWGGNGWYCIDGHHRLEAYRRGGWPTSETLPVCVFGGSLAKAMLAAGFRNTPDKLPMGKAEKTQAAWEFVASTATEDAIAEYICKAFCVSERMVRFMRKVRRWLGENLPTEDPSAMTWEAARRAYAGEDDEPRTEDEWNERDMEDAKKMADSIVKAVGQHRLRKQRALLYALEIIDSRFPAFAATEWREHIPEAEGGDNPDF
jgi:hypothetical protein